MYKLATLALILSWEVYSYSFSILYVQYVVYNVLCSPTPPRARAHVGLLSYLWFTFPEWLANLKPNLWTIDLNCENLQEEAKNQESEDKAAAVAATERQRMLESEKENIERKPFMDIQSETKRFRQDVFKRRHRARALVKQNPTVSSSKTTIC